MSVAFDVPETATYVPDVAEQTDLIRDAILAEYARRKLNPYQLWKLVEGSGISRATVYAFANGKTTLNTENATRMMAVLGLQISRTRKRTES